jgi:hypothetical protein
VNFLSSVANPTSLSRCLSILVLLAMLGAGCHREEISVVRVPKVAEPPAPSPIRFQLPSGWTEVPAAKMSVALFSIADHKAELSVMSFPGEGASQLSLINVVRDTSGLPPLSDAELAKLTEPVTVGDAKGSLVNLTGSTTGNSTSSNEVLVAVVPHEGTTWFFKLIGNAQTVAAQKPAMIDFLKSVSFVSGAEIPSPHVEMSSAGDTGQMPQDNTGAAPVNIPSPEPDKPAWIVPTGWHEAETPQFVLAKYVANGPDGDASVTVSQLAGEGGGFLMNINRWRGQVGLAPLGDDETSKAFTPLDVPGGKAMLVDVNGKGKNGKDTRIVGIIWPRDGQTWFYKLTGDTPAAARVKDDFLKFVQSVRYPNG